MHRALFKKTGTAIWISHLDLMRLFQRAFKRAGLPLTHTQGFNQRPSVSIALPLSVGVSSDCELLDFTLEESFSCDEIKNRLNAALVEGVEVLDVYENGRKLRDLALLECTVDLIYDAGVPQGAAEAVSGLFASDSVIVPKKTKSGVQDQDLIPMIRKLAVSEGQGNMLQLHGVVCCQNPTLNPAQLALAVSTHLPDFKPDHSVCHRIEIFDPQESIFR